MIFIEENLLTVNYKKTFTKFFVDSLRYTNLFIDYNFIKNVSKFFKGIKINSGNIKINLMGCLV